MQNSNLKRINEIVERFNEDFSSESKVMVLYTGGTIGMIKNADNVFSPLPNELEKRIRLYPQLHDVEYATKQFPSYKDSIIVIPSTKDAKRIVYFIYEYDPLLDSSDMNMDDYISIGKDIQKSYSLFDGFVILHGTDTLGYTASALSFLCENLGKSIIITGAQIPLFEARSDGRENFLNSVLLAGNYCIPEVMVFFNNKLLRGNRTVKVSTSSLDAFNSPNMTPLIEIGTSIKVDWNSIFRSPYIEAFKVHEDLNKNVGLLRVFPSITSQTVHSFLCPPIQGVVLQTYGSGNCPSNRADITTALKRASDSGILILNITQCAMGAVSVMYETGKVLVDAGVIPGSDMTPEAALSKLSYVLSKDDWSLEMKRKKLQENLRGELTAARSIRLEDIELIKAIGKHMRLSTSAEYDELKEILYPSILNSVAKIGDVEKLEILHKTGANLSSQDYDKRTPLHIAVCDGHLKVMEYLLKNGASVHQMDRSNKTPLMNAIEFNQHEAICLLNKAGASLQISKSHLADLLTSAAQQGNIKLIESLHLAGADLNTVDSNNVSALHRAVEYSRIECVNFLMSKKVDASFKDVFGRTAYDVAVILKLQPILDVFGAKE